MLKVGLVGCGFMGRMHATVYGTLDDADLVTVHDKDPERAKALAESFGISTTSNYEDLLTSECDIIDICLPTDLHSEFTVKAAQAGKHVLCEKPMAINLNQAQAMIDACAQAGVKLMIGHCIRYWPEYALLKEIKDSGRIGKLLSLNLTRYGQFPTWGADNWLAKEERAGGGVLDMHIHDTDFAHYLLGEPDHMVSFGTINETGPAHAFTTQTYGDAIVHLEGGWNMAPGTPFNMSYRAVFEKGTVLFDHQGMRIYEEGKEPEIPTFESMKATGGGNISDLGGYYHEIKSFINSILSDEELTIVTPQSSYRSLETTLKEIELIKSR